MPPVTEPTRTLADLEQWAFAGTALAVLGQPIAHSLSPVMHNAALADLARTEARFEKWRYFKFEIAPTDLPRALGLFHAKGFAGLNLTVPHKSLALPHLAAADETVRTAGAANTLRRTDAGWEGFNTDGYGLTRGLHESLGVDLAGAKVVLLGAGGAARGAAAECLRRKCGVLWIGNRTAENLAALLGDLRSAWPQAEIRGFDLAQPAELPSGAVVINATALGLQPGDPVPIDLFHACRPACVFDMIYQPPSTKLLRQAAVLNLPIANGLAMLVHQGARALELWSGVAAPVEIMRGAVRAHLPK